MAEIDIPPAALEAAARKITAVTMGLANVGDRLPDTLWKQYLPEARAALLAGLKAWPGMEQRTSGHHPRGIGGPGEVVTRRIILPLPQEGE